MKYVNALAFVAALAGAVACGSSDGDSDGTEDAGSTGGSTPGAGGSTPGAGGSTPGAGGSTPGAGGSTPGAGGSTSNPDAIVAECPDQSYTPAAAGGTDCATTAVPTIPQIADFETAPAGWGVYKNVDASAGSFTPATVDPSAGGPEGSTMALSYEVVGVEGGIKLEVGFGTQCQDVRTFDGLSFWAKGDIDAATVPFAAAADELIINLGSQHSLLGGCTEAPCAAAPPDKRVILTPDWKEYRIPFDCFGDAEVFDGYYKNILFLALGTNSSFAINQVAYY